MQEKLSRKDHPFLLVKIAWKSATTTSCTIHILKEESVRGTPVDVLVETISFVRAPKGALRPLKAGRPLDEALYHECVSMAASAMRPGNPLREQMQQWLEAGLTEEEILVKRIAEAELARFAPPRKRAA